MLSPPRTAPLPAARAASLTPPPLAPRALGAVLGALLAAVAPTLAVVAAGALALVAAAAAAHADPGAALVTGALGARQRAVVREALEDELRQAGWMLRPLADDEAAVLASCLGRAQPWPCLAPLAAAHHLARLVELRVEREPPGRGRRPLRLTGQLGHLDRANLVADTHYCSPCSDLQLATATRLLARRLLAGGSLRDAATRLEVRTTPPGATLRIDGRMVEAPDGTVALAPGLHTVHLQLTGYRTEMRAIAIEEGKRALLELELTPLPPRPPPPTRPAVEEIDPRVMPPADAPRAPPALLAPPAAAIGATTATIAPAEPAKPSAPAPLAATRLTPSPAEPPPRAPLATPATASAAPAATRRPRAAWALALGGAALLLGGSVLLVLDEDLPEGPAERHRPSYRDSAPAGLALASLGALTAAAGLTLWFVAPPTPPRPAPSSSAGASLGAGVGYVATF